MGRFRGRAEPGQPASGAGLLPDGIGLLLEERYCACGKFIVCPIFQRFQKSLARVHDELDAMAVHNGGDGEDDGSGVYRLRRRSNRNTGTG